MAIEKSGDEQEQPKQGDHGAGEAGESFAAPGGNDREAQDQDSENNGPNGRFFLLAPGENIAKDE